jgi:adenine-specific DNA methylase
MDDNLFGEDISLPVKEKANVTKKKNGEGNEPPNLGKAVRLPVVDFSDPSRPLTCLEVDFPIAPINALSQLEGNAGKPIYQMSKWWARRRSSIFRSMLIAAAVQAPEDKSQAAKLVWDYYYANHQKAGNFKNLKVLDLFMGGGTTIVEGSRLGFQMIGNDLNPIAWFVCRNELSRSDPKTVKAFFDKIEEEVKPLVQPYYTTTCPRGHHGYWIDKETAQKVDIDPLEVPIDQRKKYEWHGPEVIYTFWAKHGSCQAEGCGHRTPIFGSPVVAQKKLSTQYIETICPDCGKEFHVELGETRMAPGAERIILNTEHAFTETTQQFGQLLCDYGKGNGAERTARIGKLLDLVDDEPGLRCPECNAFTGQQIKAVLERHSIARRASDINKKDFDIGKKKIQMYLLIHPDWLKGVGGFDENGNELGGWAGASPEDTGKWYNLRIEKLSIIEVRGELLTDHIVLNDGTSINTQISSIPKQAQFLCSKCGRSQDRLNATKAIKHTSPVSTYLLQCYCPECELEGYNYSGRYFKKPDKSDVKTLIRTEQEWGQFRNNLLAQYWPNNEIEFSMRTHVKDPLPDHGYTHWWMMFNARQLLVHAHLLSAIETHSNSWPVDIIEQALGAFQQYLRNQNMFCIWNISADKMEPFFSENNYNPRQLTIENSVFTKLGRGNWESSTSKCLNALLWVREPWERLILEPNEKSKSGTSYTNDPVNACDSLLCSSSTDLGSIPSNSIDLVVTDPPFGDNIYYADLAEFFYVWLRQPILRLYEDMPERAYFEPERTPHSTEAIDNYVEHPDDRQDYEKQVYVTEKCLEEIRRLSGDESIQAEEPNPFYRREPAPEFYRTTLTACWSEAYRVLKPGGLMAFTFHHSEDDPWVDVLESLFESDFILIVTYPVLSDESKGENASFGSKKIEYDIIHVCRKRIEEPLPVSWAKMRRWVRDEGARLKEMLETSHGTEIPESDLRVIMIGKSLEFYSRHYGQVFTGDGELLCVRDALLGIDQLIDDLFTGEAEREIRPPSEAEPASRLFLRIFASKNSISRDELHKTLRGTGLSQLDLEARGWIRVTGTTVNVVPIEERFEFYTTRGRTRKVIKTDLDQAYFLIGACMGDTGVNVKDELDKQTFNIKRSVDAILKWFSERYRNAEIKQAAGLALRLVSDWRAKPKAADYQPTLFDMLDSED